MSQRGRDGVGKDLAIQHMRAGGIVAMRGGKTQLCLSADGVAQRRGLFEDGWTKWLEIGGLDWMVDEPVYTLLPMGPENDE